VLHVALQEDGDANKLAEPDVFAPGALAGKLAGRILALEAPAPQLPELPVEANGVPSFAELFDRFVAVPELRTWLDAQPLGAWPLSGFVADDYNLEHAGKVRLKLMSPTYDRAATVTADGDGSRVAVSLPRETDRRPDSTQRPGTLPPGRRTIFEPDGFDLAEDVLAGELKLPSGRIVVSEFFTEEEPLPIRVRPGAYPAFVTLAHAHGDDERRVALATLVLSDRPTVRWRKAGGIAVDGGSGSFGSKEVASTFGRLALERSGRWDELWELIWDAQDAQGHVTNYDVDSRLNLIHFSTGLGDGGYPIYVGYDAKGEPTRVVLDCLLLHLDWPG
jgi:hypothetical protein